MSLVLLAVGLIVWVTLPSAAAKSQTVVIGGGPYFRFDAGVSPSLLPRERPAPIALELGVGVDGAHDLPSLSRTTIEFDRQAAIDTEGLPTCSYEYLRNSSRSSARQACRGAIVGSGKVRIDIPGDIAYGTVLTAFNGGTRLGVTTLFVQGEIVAPFPEVVVATVRIRSIDQGRYGLEAVTTIPPIYDGEAPLRSFYVTVDRGVSVRCRREDLRAKLVGYSLENGETFSPSERLVTPVTCRRR
jgi:hypothetical protein